jgi:N-acetylglucosaminyl-diphospho-decaprenol L-rhamnosyltransferase
MANKNKYLLRLVDASRKFSKFMELTIAINGYKNPELLRLCLNSIRKNVKKIEYELIVADSETEEDTKMMMREDFPDVKFFPYKKNVGFQVMFNRGIKESRTPFILALNSDIIVTPGSVEELLKFVKNNSDMGIAAPKLLNFNGTFQPSCFRFYKPVTIIYRRTFLKNFGFARRHLDWFLMKDYDHKKSRAVDWVMGSAMLVRREAIEKVGPMDSNFFMYMEDVDWCRRFWENRYKVMYFPFSEMHHYHGKGSARGGFAKSLLFNKLTWIHISSAVKYFKKYWGKPVPLHK